MRPKGTHARGSAVAEYLGVVAVVAALMAGLLALRPQVVSRRPPVQPLAPFARLLAELRPPPPPTRVVPALPRRPRRATPARPRPAPLVVSLPAWFGG